MISADAFGFSAVREMDHSNQAVLSPRDTSSKTCVSQDMIQTNIKLKPIRGSFFWVLCRF